LYFSYCFSCIPHTHVLCSSPPTPSLSSSLWIGFTGLARRCLWINIMWEYQSYWCIINWP
jgi:hypothetical protein